MKTPTRKQMEEKYNCEIFKDSGFDSGMNFWVAYGEQDDEKDQQFVYADGWTLSELHENILEAIEDYRQE